MYLTGYATVQLATATVYKHLYYWAPPVPIPSNILNINRILEFITIYFTEGLPKTTR